MHFLKCRIIRLGVVLVAGMVLLNSPGAHARVSEDQALAIADLWLTLQINSHPTVRDAQGERQIRPAAFAPDQLWYYLTSGELVEQLYQGEQVSSYVITFAPTGFVVVSADESVSPIVMHNTRRDFVWQGESSSFIRLFLERVAKRQAAATARSAASGWDELRSILATTEPHRNLSWDDIEHRTAVNYILWHPIEWGQGSPYNAHIADYCAWTDDVNTGCNATAMAMKLRFHAYPIRPAGQTPSYQDDVDGDQCQHTLTSNLATRSYDFSQMPARRLDGGENFPEVGELMFDAAVSIESDFGSSSTGAGHRKTRHAMHDYFRYRLAEEVDKDDTDHDLKLKNSILGGLPVYVHIRGHNIVASGYQQVAGVEQFYFSMGWNGGPEDTWYQTDDTFPGDRLLKRSFPYQSPKNYFYIDQGWSGTEDGNISTPFTSISQGYDADPQDQGPGQDSKHLWIKGGSYSTVGLPGTLTTPMTLRSYNGAANISERVIINTTADDEMLDEVPLIQIKNGGKLIINP